MKRQSQIPKKAINVLEDVEKLKQRREERKIKNNEEKKEEKNSGKFLDTDYENLMKKKKTDFNIPAAKVNKNN